MYLSSQLIILPATELDVVELLEPEDTLAARIQERDSAAKQKLTAAQIISTIIPRVPPESQVHIPVTLGPEDTLAERI